jgi:UrcA family protein
MRRSIIAAFGLSLALATPAFADTAELINVERGYSIHLSVSPDDLTSDQALHALYGRIDAAATTICRQLDFEDSSDTISFTACKQSAVRRAVEDANIASLSRHYAAVRSGWSPSSDVARAD